MEDRIRVAANALVVRDGRALLVAFDDATGPHYNFPGGGVELNETLEEAVCREVMEEASLDVKVERLLIVVQSVGSKHMNYNAGLGHYIRWNEVRFFFLVTPVSSNDEARLPDQPDAHEVGVVWMPLDELPDQPVLPQVSRELLAALRNPTGPTPIVPNPHLAEPWMLQGLATAPNA